MMQLKNLHENVTIERVNDYAWNEPLISLLILSLLELLTIIVCLNERVIDLSCAYVLGYGFEI